MNDSAAIRHSTETKDPVAIFTRLYNGVGVVNRTVTVACGVAIIALTLVVIADITFRKLGSPLPGATESGELMMPWVTFLAFGYALFAGYHPRVTMLQDRLSPRARQVCEVLVAVAGLIVVGLVTFWGWQYFWESFVIREEMFARVKMPLYVGKFSFPLGMGLISLQFLTMLFLRLAQLFSGRSTPAQVQEVKE